MKKISFFALAALLTLSNSVAKSVSKVQTGYTQVDSASSGYNQVIPGQNQVHRYLYSAFQRGYAEGNLQMNQVGARFDRVPWMNVANLVMTQPGYSTLDFYFQKRSQYRVKRAELGILGRSMDFNRAVMQIKVNGSVLEGWYSPRDQRRFQERLLEVGSQLQDGLNHVQVKLRNSGGPAGVLGVKVETWEVQEGFGDDSSHMSDREFINATFQRYHHRYPTQRETRRYLRALRHNSREQVRQRIRREANGGGSHSGEYVELVEEYFLRYANRLPTASEREMYARRLRNNSLTLPEFRRILEGLNGGDQTQYEDRIRDEFWQTLRRYPTADELSYYSRRLRNNTMSWSEFRREVRMLDSTQPGTGLGFSYEDVQRMDFRTVVTNTGFMSRLRGTQRSVLRVLLRKAQSSLLYGQGVVEKRNAQTVVDAIRRIRPELVH